MDVVSFMSANYVARELGYQMSEGWRQGDTATNAHFRPLATFTERFEEIVRDIHALGFRALDLWTAHLNPAWATPEHIAQARAVLARYNMAVVSLAGSFGDTAAAVRASCELAVHLEADLLGGTTGLLATDRPQLVAILKAHNVRLGVENHGEKTPLELLATMGDSEDGLIGAAVDTGWWAVHGYDAAQALDVLGDRVLYVHLKDILPPAPSATAPQTLKALGHETCAYGQGIVPLQACLEVLRRIGYSGGLSIEHEPETYDPTSEVAESLAVLQQWLGVYHQSM